MPRALRLTFGFVLVVAGLIGLSVWRWGNVTPDNGKGIFLLSVLGLLAGVNSLLRAVGVSLFAGDGNSDSRTSLFDGDGDGGGGGDGGD